MTPGVSATALSALADELERWAAYAHLALDESAVVSGSVSERVVQLARSAAHDDDMVRRDQEWLTSVVSGVEQLTADARSVAETLVRHRSSARERLAAAERELARAADATDRAVAARRRLEAEVAAVVVEIDQATDVYRRSRGLLDRAGRRSEARASAELALDLAQRDLQRHLVLRADRERDLQETDYFVRAVAEASTSLEAQIKMLRLELQDVDASSEAASRVLSRLDTVGVLARRAAAGLAEASAALVGIDEPLSTALAAKEQLLQHSETARRRYERAQRALGEIASTLRDAVLDHRVERQVG